ncbi:Na+/H+ antiporter NhaC [Solibacillus sp. CAU 1738]|uniref:Na+/H+ antiporter NhaC n=1 Tax=Solibacillus sp. CAU 1738 TaxID=3140363 RepID=UPI0032612662
MLTSKSFLQPKIYEALLIITAIIFIITLGVGYYGAKPHISILFSIFLLIGYGLYKKVPFSNLEKSMITGASSGIGAVYIFLLIGFLISSWIIGGTIPTLLFYGFSIISAHYFYAIVFIITSIVGTVIGSSLTTVATVGVALLGIGTAFDASIAITAGAIVSGAFFGDKMSPLSDTTNLAASIVNIDLFTHIRNMMWTTIPVFIISTIFYALLSPSVEAINSEIITSYKTALGSTNLVHLYALIPLLLLVICTLFKLPAPLTLVISSISGIVLSFFHLSLPLQDLLNILYSGYESNTGFESLDTLLTRGGISSMYFTIMLVLLSLSMGGLLFALGIIQTLLATIEALLTSAAKVITGAAITAIMFNILIGEQYLSILLTGEAFKEKFRALNLHPKNLSRVMEDAGTVINPLVPWSVCGLFISSTLEVSTMSYVPFAFFCLLSPIITVLFAWLNKTLTYIK